MKVKMRDGTGELKLKHLVEDTDRHGNVRIYFRKKGQPKVRLEQSPGTDAFLEEYRSALNGEAPKKGAEQPTRHPAVKGSLRWLCERYYAECGAFKRMQKKGVRRGILDDICEQRGDKPYLLMERRHVRRIRDEKEGLPEAGNARVKALRQLFKFAIDDDLAKVNPAASVDYIKSGTDGFHTWTITEVEQFKARHPRGTKPRKAMALLAFLGVRRSDAVALGPQMETTDGQAINFTETKGASRLVKQRLLPILPELRAELDASPSGHLAYLVTAFGKPFTANGFGNWFRDRCDEAGLPHCTAHGLRKAGATIAAENGATEYQLMAIYGWESTKQAQLYTRRANRAKLAAEAMHLIVPPEQKGDESVPLSGGVKKSGTIRGKK